MFKTVTWRCHKLEAERGTSCQKLSFSCLSASWLTLIQWTSVLSAVVQRAVYPANVQLINLWSWPKIEDVQLSAGLWQGYWHWKPRWFQKALPTPPLLPFLPSKCVPWRREGLCLCSCCCKWHVVHQRLSLERGGGAKMHFNYDGSLNHHVLMDILSLYKGAEKLVF